LSIINSSCNRGVDININDTVTIVATDVAGNEAEQPITVSVKIIGLSTSIVWSGIGDDHKINV
jgi:hypothetical protein